MHASRACGESAPERDGPSVMDRLADAYERRSEEQPRGVEATSLEMVYEMATSRPISFKQELPLPSIQPH